MINLEPYKIFDRRTVETIFLVTMTKILYDKMNKKEEEQNGKRAG
jgi:hypothetical protein